MDPGAVRSGLKKNLESVTGLTCYGREPQTPNVPCAWSWPTQPFIERDAMAKGVMAMNYAVTVIVSSADSDMGQKQLDDLMNTSGASSVWSAIELDKTLSGACDNCIVNEVRRYDGNYVVDSTQYFAAEFYVTAYGKG